MVETVLAMIARRCEIGTTVALPVDVGRRAAVSSRQSNQTASPARRPRLFLRISIAVDGSAAEVSISAAAARRRRMLGDPTATGAPASPAGPDRKRLGRGRSAKPTTAVARLHLP